MSDFDEFIDFITDVIGDSIDQIPEETDIAEHVQETIQSVLDKLSDSDFEIDDERKEVLIEKLANALHLSEEEVSEQWDAITNVDPASFEDPTSNNVSELDEDKKWTGEFTGNCWNECRATTGYPGKRMACGYHL